MAIKWVRATGGSDSNNGDSYTAAWATINRFAIYLNASGVKGDILNVVNDSGVHEMPTSATAITASLLGTNYDTDPGFVIRGTDSNGNQATAQVTVGNMAVSAALISFQTNVRFVRIDGLDMDLSPGDPANGFNLITANGATAGPVRLTACRIKGYTDNHVNYGDAVRKIFNSTGTAQSNFGEIRYCVIENCPYPVEWENATTTVKGSVNHCVVWIKGDYLTTQRMWWNWAATANSANIVEFYNNTIYIDTDDTVSKIISAAPISGNYGTVNFHSNVFWIESTSVAADVIEEIFDGSSGSTATYAGDIGYNIIYTGPNIASGDVGDIYEDPWDAAEDPKITDIVQYEKANTVLFYNPTSTWNWYDIGGTDYELTIPADLRILLHTTAGLSGVLPGALPSYQTDYTITIVTDKVYPEPEEDVQITITAENNGTAAVDLEITSLIPAGLTYVSHTPSAGTYVQGTGIWTLSTLADAGSETLVINTTVDADQAGNDIVLTAELTDANPLTDPDTSDNIDTVTLTVLDLDEPGDIDSAKEFVSVFPIYTEVWRYEMHLMMQLHRNRIQTHYHRYDNEERGLRELSFDALVVPAATTTTVRIGGIERGHTLIVQSDVAVQVSAQFTDNQFWPACLSLCLDEGDFEKIKIKNTSSTESASVIIGVSD